MSDTLAKQERKISSYMTREEWMDTMDEIRLPEQDWIHSRDRAIDIEEVSQIISAKLEGLGFWCLRDKKDWITVVDIHGNAQILDSSKYRNLSIIPSIMSSECRVWCRELQYFLDSHPKAEWCRMGVSTSGDRCTVDELADRIQAQSRRMSRAACEMRKNGIEIIYSGAEYTIKKEVADNKIVYRYHPHQHFLIIPLKRFQIKTWKKLTAMLKKMLGGYHLWISEKPVTDAKYVTKYVAKVAKNESDKDSETVSITDLPPDDLLALATTLFNHKVKTKRAYGLFRDMRTKWKNEKIAPKRVKTGDKVWSWRLVQKKKEKAQVEEQAQDEEPEKANVQDFLEKDESACSDLVVGTTISAILAPVLRKSLIVINYQGDFQRLLNRRYKGINPLVSLPPPVAPPPEYVHSCTLTVVQDVSLREALGQMRQLKESFFRGENNS